MTMTVATKALFGMAAPAGGGSFDPTSVDGCALWLDASDAGSFTYHSGSLISQWDDLSGEGHDATQSNSGLSPERTGTQNGLTTVVFGGEDNPGYLNFADVFSSLTAATFFITYALVEDPPTDVNDTGMFWFGTATTRSHHPYTDGIVYDGFGSTTRKDTGNPSTDMTAWNTYRVLTKSGEWTSWFDGTQFYTTATNTVGFKTACELGHAFFPATTNYYLNGEVGEVLLYDNDISDDDAADIEDYLATKWGL